MPRRKPKPEKVIQEKIKENLDAIIMEESLDSVSLDSGDLPRLKTTELMNFADEKVSALSEAKAFGLDSSSVKIEKFPMIINPPKDCNLHRIM